MWTELFRWAAFLSLCWRSLERLVVGRRSIRLRGARTLHGDAALANGAAAHLAQVPQAQPRRGVHSWWPLGRHRPAAQTLPPRQTLAGNTGAFTKIKNAFAFLNNLCLVNIDFISNLYTFFVEVGVLSSWALWEIYFLLLLEPEKIKFQITEF